MKKIILAMLFSVFLLSAIAVPSLSQATVGLEVGDHFMWVGSYSHETNDPGQMIPGQVSPYSFWNETDYVNRTVTAISGTNVTFDTLWHYSNGTDVTETETQDITGASTGYLATLANLDIGDEFTQYDSFSYGPLNITDIVMIDYGEGDRETTYHFSTTGLFAVVGREYWFDRLTGICVKAKLNATLADTSVTTYILELKDTNLWIIPEFPTGTVMLLVFVAVTVCVDIYRRKKLKRQIG